MKLLALLLISMSASADWSRTNPSWERTYPTFQYRTDYNGIYNQIHPDNRSSGPSWSYKSHMVPHFYNEVPGVYCHFCKKVQTHYFDTKWVKGREVKYNFHFRVDKWNFEDPPSTVIVFQQLITKNNTDRTIHPITTLKLTRWKGLSLGLFDQAWQWEQSKNVPYDRGDPEDKKHRHPFAASSGYQKLEVGENYAIELVFIDGLTPESGMVKLRIDGVLVAESKHRVRSTTGVSSMMWGLYWQGGFKNGYNGSITNKCEAKTGIPDLVCKSIQTTMLYFRVYERINLVPSGENS